MLISVKPSLDSLLGMIVITDRKCFHCRLQILLLDRSNVTKNVASSQMTMEARRNVKRSTARNLKKTTMKTIMTMTMKFKVKYIEIDIQVETKILFKVHQSKANTDVNFNRKGYDLNPRVILGIKVQQLKTFT